MLATKKQVIVIKALASKIYSDDDEYRFALKSYGVDSSKKLTIEQASSFITKLSLHKKSSKTQQNPAAGGTAPAAGSAIYTGTGKRGMQRHLTAAQGVRISILEKILGWNKNSTYDFIKKQTGKNKSVEMLMNYEAGKVIVGMQMIIVNSDKEKYKSINAVSNKVLNSTDRNFWGKG